MAAYIGTHFANLWIEIFDKGVRAHPEGKLWGRTKERGETEFYLGRLYVIWTPGRFKELTIERH